VSTDFVRACMCHSMRARVCVSEGREFRFPALKQYATATRLKDSEREILFVGGS